MLPSKPCLMALAAGVMLASGVTGARAADQKLFVWAEAVEPRRLIQRRATSIKR